MEEEISAIRKTTVLDDENLEKLQNDMNGVKTDWTSRKLDRRLRLGNLRLASDAEARKIHKRFGARWKWPGLFRHSRNWHYEYLGHVLAPGTSLSPVKSQRVLYEYYKVNKVIDDGTYDGFLIEFDYRRGFPNVRVYQLLREQT